MNDISVSTHTFIAYTNLNDLDLECMFDEIEIGNFLTHILYKKREKGYKKGKKPRVNTKKFLNCVSFTFNKNDKKVNLKLFRNGVIQLTGCKNFDHCKLGLVLFWDIIKNINSCLRFDHLESYLVSVKRNVNFNLGFLVDSKKLGNYIIKKVGHYKITPIIGGFIGLQFIVAIDSIDEMPVYKIKIEKDGTLKQDDILYKDFLKINKQSNKSLKKSINITIFQTGRVLFSGIHEKYQSPLIEWFLNLVHEVKDDIKTIDVDNKFSYSN